ncbi:50S ribosomal protein L11 methyltransferase [Kamptonema cortianum]|nr:50S ribosomal protein L11 methyltransferase [Oscillatoria laete-virens]MDK3156459.1 50S ribosomal protein L11 methyltransferase [Kamptonema cortianum]MDL5053857.1 50S ribosomal protein L11 methyltransferase [Oscillatoria laete-virens NRMC-F 0139]
MPLSPRLKPVLVWRRNFRRADGQELLAQFRDIDPARLVISGQPPKPGIQVEIYPENSAEGRKLLRSHGGKLLRLTPKTWWLPQEPRSEPLRIGRQLLVVTTEAQKVFWAKKYPTRKLLVIPASLAFGTGEHATTEMCLRQIARIPDWPQKSLLDIGTGTGILAIAARALGCARIDAFDNDKRSIIVAKENEELNFSVTAIRWKTVEIEKFQSKAAYDCVTANLYSELLITHAAQIARALKPGGKLLLSGIFEDQIGAVLKAFQKTGLAPASTKRKGRWWCAVFSKP